MTGPRLVTDLQRPPKRTPAPCGKPACEFWRSERCTRSYCPAEVDRDLGPGWPTALAEKGGAL